MKLDRVDELAFGTFDHHLITAKVRSSQEFKTIRYAVQLETMILPDSKNASALLLIYYILI